MTSRRAHRSIPRHAEGRRGSRILALCLVAAIGRAATGSAGELASEAEVQQAVRVSGVTASNALVRADLHNQTDAELRDVRLLLVHEFLWHDEMHPGGESPGRSETILVERVPPGAAVPLRHAIVPPLPERSDGSFTTRIEVLGFTQVGP